MPACPTRLDHVRPQRRWKLLIWVTALSILVGALNAGEIFEDGLRTIRNSLHKRDASGEIVFVGIDDRSLRQIGEWPWPRAKQAELIDAATRHGARKIYVDLIYDSPTDAKNDQAFADALARSGRVTLVDREKLGAQGAEKRVEGQPLPLFAQRAQLASASFYYNYQHAVWRLPYEAEIRGQRMPTLASGLSDQPVLKGKSFRIDYSIVPYSVPYISAADLLSGSVDSGRLRGKKLMIGLNADQTADIFWIPGYGRMTGPMVHILGAETLKAGRQIDLGWLAPLLLSLVLAADALMRRNRAPRALMLGLGVAALLVVPVALESRSIFVDVFPSLFALAIVIGRLTWVRWRHRGLTNALTELPNLEALRASRTGKSQALIAARVHNFAQIGSTLSSTEEREMVRQIVQRLTVTGGTNTVYQGDEGIFAWFLDTASPLANHVEALHSLFRSPIAIDGRQVDIALTFGVEAGGNRSLANRLGSALVAADEAWNDGLKWKFHDPARQEELSWRLSLLGQLDAAIDNGEVWVAFQPQYDLHRHRVIGAEALARWTHPEKGPISPSEFVAAAEQNGRIAKLTDFVLDRAIGAAAAINRRGIEFTVAVNVSARLLAERNFFERVGAVLKVHGLSAHRLTLELTETEALSNADGALPTLDRLRDLGVRIAIDDYGTGQSTLEYLKKVPANEIKIDQSFVRAMRVNRSDHILVESTIALAHSLGRTVVAEGVEDHRLLETLATMGCDVAQGYAVGRPMGIRELVQRLRPKNSRRVA